jgi:hypothetical protein
MLAGLRLLGWGLWWRYGPAWAWLGVAMYGVFLGDALTLFRPAPGRGLPSSVRMRKRAMPLVMIGDVVLLIIPLAAG